MLRSFNRSSTSTSIRLWRAAKQHSELMSVTSATQTAADILAILAQESRTQSNACPGSRTNPLDCKWDSGIFYWRFQVKKSKEIQTNELNATPDLQEPQRRSLNKYWYFATYTIKYWSKTLLMLFESIHIKVMYRIRKILFLTKSFPRKQWQICFSKTTAIFVNDFAFEYWLCVLYWSLT